MPAIIAGAFGANVLPVTAAKSSVPPATATRMLAVGESYGCVVTCQGREPASTEEWSLFLEAAARHMETTTRPRLLVVTAGGAPSPEQRKKFDQISEKHRAGLKIAIVTDSTFARGVVRAIRLFYPFYQAFALSELDEALRFLGVRSVDVLVIKRFAEELRASLSG